MAEDRAVLKVTGDLKAAVSAILQGYGDGQQCVTDASAELHRLCGCLELLLQFDQKEQRSFLGPRKDYWDFFCTALRRQQGNMEPAHFVHSQDKLKTPLGKGRAFIRFCLAHGQLAESLQLCLLDLTLTRKWYGPRSPLVCPELQEDLLDCLYTLNGVSFDLDLQRPDLDEAWPMFSESCCFNSRQVQGRRPRKTKASPKKISAAPGGRKGVHQEEPHPTQGDCLGDASKEGCLAQLPGSEPHKHLSPFLEKKREDPRSHRSPWNMWEPEEEELQQVQREGAPRPGIYLQNPTPSIQGQGEGAKGVVKEATGTETKGTVVLSGAKGQRSIQETHEGEVEWGHAHRLLVSNPRQTTEEEATLGYRQELEPSILGDSQVLQGLGKGEGSITEKPQEQTQLTSLAGREKQAEVPLQDLVKSLRHQLLKATEQVQHQEQLLREQEGVLKALQEQLSRCQEEKAGLQAALEQKQQESERKDALYQEELGGQRDLVQAMKRRVLELIQEKDNLWQKVQHLSSVVPGCCVSCSKIFGRLSRRYPCRLCGGLVCHACSTDYKKRECCCPACAQRRDAQF
ncbi:PREDICTED: RUN and FYVE domain-containing protein 4 [Chrysochloris asiatica]|uniref:RUN and FYVE domain-containing protein 4 n=1 Tax=Chrysochloris asiatica TaxID=185453 RepID=A0A9B0TPI9_CHRAS|nr:PREDICTED: RUN and FYVE domain-containing protein 4 [Chrysochloris asiatica]